MHPPADLAPESRRIFAEMQRLGLLDATAETPMEMRRLAAEERQLFGTGPEVARLEDFGLETPAGPLPLRVYWPSKGAERAILWLHGGGWVIGDLAQGDADSRRLCVDTNSLVVAAEYRLAPEHPFPAGLEDAYAALSWLAAELGRRRIVVAGDSAGGNLAAALCLMARQRGGPEIDHQLLIYPVTSDDFDSASYRRFGRGYVLTRDAMVRFWEHYVGGAGAEAPDLAAVLRYPELSGLPPATFVIAGCDVLRDEGEAYAARLAAAGVPVEVLRYPGQLHSFWTYGGYSELPRRVNAEVRRSFLGSEHP